MSHHLFKRFVKESRRTLCGDFFFLGTDVGTTKVHRYGLNRLNHLNGKAPILAGFRACEKSPPSHQGNPKTNFDLK
jgi:hypothetical protein